MQARIDYFEVNCLKTSQDGESIKELEITPYEFNSYHLDGDAKHHKKNSYI